MSWLDQTKQHQRWFDAGKLNDFQQVTIKTVSVVNLLDVKSSLAFLICLGATTGEDNRYFVDTNWVENTVKKHLEFLPIFQFDAGLIT